MVSVLLVVVVAVVVLEVLLVVEGVVVVASVSSLSDSYEKTNVSCQRGALCFNESHWLVLP